MSEIIEILMKKGVCIPNPDSVEIGDGVQPERVSGKDVVIHSGCKIFGAKTFIHEGCRIGHQGPVTMENCRIGADVHLGGGFFRHTVFLNGARAGSGAHVREGTIFEEEARISHTVGLKQTILFPFVTLGSLINFCDCLMAGGSSRTNHSEVGSSFIHFNYTPNQDKATPSLIGDVPHGVMLTQSPIFLGGQGGLVGPCRLAFGTITAAGTICRQDETEPGMLLFDRGGPHGRVPFQFGLFQNVNRIAVNNFLYIANLIALSHWYRHVRGLFVSEAFPEALLNGLEENVLIGISERIHQFDQFVGRLGRSIQVNPDASEKRASKGLIRQKSELCNNWTELMSDLSETTGELGEDGLRSRFLDALERRIRMEGPDYVTVIRGLPGEVAEIGSRWLQSIVDQVSEITSGRLPSFRV